jgi:hypothetical protein
LADISQLQEKHGLYGNAAEYTDSEKILHASVPTEPTCEVDANVAAATKEALTSLGLYNPTLTAFFQDEDTIMASEVFRNAVISGVVATQAIKKKICSDETAAALFSLLAYSSDGELAGAAFRSLLCMLGENTVYNGTRVDAGYGFETIEGNNDEKNSPVLELSVKGVPSAAAILKALEVNGYSPADNNAVPTHKTHKTGKEQVKEEEMEKEEEQQGQENTETIVRVYAIKLLLHTAIAVCNHCARRTSVVAKKALPAADISNLLIAVMYMGIDDAAVRLQPDLDAACTALLCALTEDDWKRELPLLSKRISQMANSSRSRLRILRQMPVNAVSGRSRVRELQRYTGCILVEKILPEKLCAKSSAIPTRLLGAPDPTDILLAQPWFRNAKAVVTGAVEPSAKAEKDPLTYTTADVEILLHLCDVLLWPSALRAVKERFVSSDAAGSSSPVKQRSMRMISQPDDDDEEMHDVEAADSDGYENEPVLDVEFLTAWSTFLTGIVRNIKTLQPDEMAVKTLASKLDFKYKETVEKPLWALSP